VEGQFNANAQSLTLNSEYNLMNVLKALASIVSICSHSFIKYYTYVFYTIYKRNFPSTQCKKRVRRSPLEPVTEVEVEVTLRLIVSQYVLVSSTLVGLATRYYFLSERYCLKFAVLFLLGALSDERTGL
jgi:hypothetical protein